MLYNREFLFTNFYMRSVRGRRDIAVFDCALSVRLGFVLDKVALRQVFPANTSASTCHYHSTNAQYSFIYHHQRCICLAVESVVQ